ncbi:hypothetical protein JN01_0605 [Entomoplasma freundtii]|uniref:Uncharacterized protein n=1 Tax=Entomoplasma freundtii TaxID=74700 RepID=A0A2K8NRE4_9MOLU|nr:hypothetical protein [Entomoplasma freundtii]ATZ16354.1 hypothetical protein EFREU_v1c03280 [Entomoplasma freundtii]TDY56607.1 hypothetical protein JN01_0605 [Entomoplasma freundtii]
MKSTKDEFAVRKYYLNEFQWFVMKPEGLAQDLAQIKYPALILDTEFFNQSHQIDANLTPLYNEKNKSIVYVLDYALIKTKKDLTLLNKDKLIKNFRLRRRLNDENYDFQKQYTQLIHNFCHLLVKNQVATIIVAGASNDRPILENWIKQCTSYFNRRSAPVILQPEPKLFMLDVYNSLENNMAFANFKADGSVFWEPKNLKPGFYGPETRQLPSLKKFFEYMSQSYPKFGFEDNADIYRLSQNALTFFTVPNFANEKTYHYLNRSVREAEHHCFNDVYKLWELLSFWQNSLKPHASSKPKLNVKQLKPKPPKKQQPQKKPEDKEK